MQYCHGGHELKDQPEYDFATRQLIYRNAQGNEVKRLPFPPRAERSERRAPRHAGRLTARPGIIRWLDQAARR